MTKRKQINLDQFFGPAAQEADDLSYLLGATPEETAQLASDRGLPLMHIATDSIAPDPHQLRHLPHPEELQRLAGSGDRASIAILASLEELGRSMQDHGQIQPVVIYPFRDPRQPAVTHRLLNGHRRWSAAVLLHLPTLWAVEVTRPGEVFRLRQQFEENERREDFSDMERSWALSAMKKALEDESGTTINWGVIEEQLQISPQRRQDLLRLFRFEREAQDIIMRYGWSEWTLRPLHMAINADVVSPEEATDMLRVLADQSDVNATVVGALVEQYRKTRPTGSTRSIGNTAAESSTRHNRKDPTEQYVSRARRSLDQIRGRLANVTEKQARTALRADLVQLRNELQTLIKELS